jgi:hypothetical protein
VKVRERFTSVPKVSTGPAKHFRRVQIPPERISSPPRNLEQQRRRRDAAGGRAETSGAGAAATPATAPRGSVDGALPLRIPFRAEKKGKSPKVPGRAEGTRGKGKGVVNAATAASALSSTQDNTVWVADVMQRLAVQGTVQPVGGKGTAQHWTAGLAVVVSGGLEMPDVHGRPAARDIKAAGDCDHAQVRVVTASGVHFSRAQTIDVLEQVLLAVRQDAVDFAMKVSGNYGGRLASSTTSLCASAKLPAFSTSTGRLTSQIKTSSSSSMSIGRSATPF